MKMDKQTRTKNSIILLCSLAYIMKSVLRGSTFRMCALTVTAVVCCLSTGHAAEAEQVTITSIEELVEYAQRSDINVRMEPGVYRMTDYFTPEKISDMNRRIKEGDNQDEKMEAAEFVSFTGNDNVFNLQGVTLEFDTEKLRAPLDQVIHTPEFVVRGNNNVLKGLNIINTGEGTSNHGNVLTVSGDNNSLQDCTLVVRGSHPYGYGTFFGTSGNKHSGLRITGDDNRFIECRVLMRSFGHAFYLQEDPQNTYFEDCHAEGSMRPTTEILEEPPSSAGKRDLTTEQREKIQEQMKPEHITSLAEDGFRFYSAGKTTFINCTAKNMRRGFFLSRGGPAHLENCVSVGNSNSFTVGPDDVLTNCRGDAKYGSLLVSEGGGQRSIDLQLLPDESELKGRWHGWGVAVIGGKKSGGEISITPWQGKERDSHKPITLGWRDVRNVTLKNKTSMPVEITEKARDCKVYSKGKILRNNGENINIMEQD